MRVIFNEKGEAIDYEIEEINTAFERLSGMERWEAAGKRAREFLPAANYLWFQRYGRVALTGEPVRFEEYNDALGKWFEVQVFSLHRDNQIIAIFSDITSNKEEEFKSNFEKAGYAEEIGLLENVNTLFRNALECNTEEEIGFACLKLAVEATCSACGFIGLINGRGLLDCIAKCDLESCNSFADQSNAVLPKNLPVKGMFRSILQGRTRIINDTGAHLDGSGFPPGHPAVRSFLGIPLFEKEKIIGIISVSNRPGGYNENDLKLMDMISKTLIQVLMRWRTEQAFLKSERSYRELFCSIDEGFLIADILTNKSGEPADLYFVEGNEAAQRILGIDCAGKCISEICPGYDSYWKEISGIILQTGKKFRIERYEELFKRWYSLFFFRIGESGCQIGILFRNITERKNRELNAFFLDEIGKEFNRFESPADILKSAGEKIKRHFAISRLVFSEVDVLRDRSTVIFDIHDLGMPSALGTGRLSDFLPPVMLCGEYRGQVIAVDDTMMDPRYAGYEDVYRKMQVRAEMISPYTKKGGRYFVLVMHSREPRKWRPDEIRLAWELSSRVYFQIERVGSQEALQKSERHALSLVAELKKHDENKNEFLSTLSHELRNPLATIVAGLSLLDLSNDKLQIDQAKEIMRRQTGQLQRLVDDLLELTRILNNRIQLKREITDLNEIVLSASEDYHALFAEKGVKLETHLYSEQICLYADQVRLAQTIGNLLQNALKFTKQGGKTMLSVRKEKNDAVVCVEDDGIGIRREFLPDLFKPFSQEDKSIDRSKGGLGLGLTIVKGITELHGGSVCAQSEGLGKGSTFYIRLPLCPGRVREQEQMPEETPGTPLRILIIEDNKDFAYVLCASLRQMGYDVAWAREGNEGISMAKDFHPDVLFCDIGLPGMNGYEIAKSFRQDELLRDIYLVALTGYAGTPDIHFARQAGFDKHLAKPADLPVLKKLLAELPVK